MPIKLGSKKVNSVLRDGYLLNKEKEPDSIQRLARLEDYIFSSNKKVSLYIPIVMEFGEVPGLSTPPIKYAEYLDTDFAYYFDKVFNASTLTTNLLLNHGSGSNAGKYLVGPESYRKDKKYLLSIAY